MTDETRDDFKDEPEEECSHCGDIYPRSKLDESGLCPWCAESEYQEDDEDYEDMEEDEDE
jgi:hypothetical protein